MSFKRIIISYKALTNTEGIKYKLFDMTLSPVAEYILYSVIISSVANESYIIAMLIGMIMFKGGDRIVTNMSNSLRTEKRYKVLELLVASPTSFFKICIDRLLFCLVESMLFVALNFFVLLIIFQLNIKIEALLISLTAITFTLLSASSLALLYTPLILPMKNVNLFSNITSSILMIFSGAIVSVPDHTLFRYFPLRNSITAAREIFLKNNYNILNLLIQEALITMVIFLFSYIFFLVSEKMVRRNGGFVDNYF